MSTHATTHRIIGRWASAEDIHRTARNHNLPGRQRSLAALRALRKTRAERNATTPATTIQQRLDARVLARYRAEIERRGGETAIHDKNSHVGLRVADHANGMYLLKAEGWRHYGSRHRPRFVRLAYLCGVDDAGLWAARVTGTLTSVAGALAEITPAEVTAARRAGRRVLRQGDVWVVETTAEKADTTRDQVIALSHHWRADTGYLVHQPEDGRKHRPLRISFPASFHIARARQMGRNGQYRGDAD